MTGPEFFRPLALLAAMREIPGWLEDEEAELLIAGTAHVFHSAEVERDFRHSSPS